MDADDDAMDADDDAMDTGGDDEGRNGSQPFHHVPVMVDEVAELFAPVPTGFVVDATIGGGGHARAILEANPRVSILGVDQDPDALAAAGAALDPERIVLKRSGFDQLGPLAAELAPASITGVLFDLGVSSPQLDRPDRGFSYRHDGPLDMRMNRAAVLTADIVVNTYPAAQLASVIRRHGDERFARRIAGAIVAARPVGSTARLADIVKDAIPAPARRRGGHPAKRTFQAIRIEVNDELGALERALNQAIDLLAVGGRCAVLSYHSGEDRIVKRCFRDAAGEAPPPRPGLPSPPGTETRVRLLWRGTRVPDGSELERNPRAGSARLRAVERVPEAA